LAFSTNKPNTGAAPIFHTNAKHQLAMALACHCEERIDAAIQFVAFNLTEVALYGLPRFAHNDSLTKLAAI